jgi:predicted transcriptional regulator
VAGTAGAPGSTREVELKRAIKAARLPSRDRNLLRDLLEIADWGTAVLPSRFQPRNIDDVARIAGVSARTAQRSLDHLAQHGWITRTQRAKPGRQGRAVTYGFQAGEDCECRAARPAPMTGAERAQRFRDRKQRQIGVTEHGIQRQESVTYNATQCYESAGQAPVSSERAVTRGNRGGDYLGGPVNWDWPEDSVGAEVNER